MSTNELRISGSRAQRIILCPGSAQAEAQFPADESTPWTEKGQRIHKWLERAVITGDCSPGAPLGDDPEEYELANQMLTDLLAVLELHGGIETPDAEIPLLALGWSGTADLLAVAKDGSYNLVDYKSGSRPVPHPRENPQMQIYAGIMADQGLIPLDAPVYAHIVTPHGTYTAVYARELLEEIIAKAPQWAAAARAENAPRIPHPDACEYCRARGTDACRESTQAIEVTQAAVTVIQPPERTIATLPSEVLADIMDKAHLLSPIIEEVETEMKKRLAADQYAFAGRYRLKSGGSTTTIVDTQGALDAIEAAGVPRQTIMVGIKISKKDVVEAHRMATGITKKACETLVDNAIAPYIVKTPKAKSLERIKVAAIAGEVNNEAAA